MKFIANIFLFFIFSFHQNLDSKNVLKKMHDKYSNKWYHTFTFTQITEKERRLLFKIRSKFKNDILFYQNQVITNPGNCNFLFLLLVYCMLKSSIQNLK